MLGDELLDLIELIHDAGVDRDLWPQVLAGVTAVMGGIGATLEIVSRQGFRYDTFYGHGVPRPEEVAYFDHYAAINPRLIAAMRQRPGEVGWDYQLFDESGMDRDPFYVEFLPRMDMRYGISAVLDIETEEFGGLSVQRSARQGHVGEPEIVLIKRLAAHISQSIQLSRRLRDADAVSRSFEQALDWLGDGVALLDADGRVLFSNQAMDAIAGARDGVTMRGGVLIFASAQSRQRFTEAYAGIRKFLSRDLDAGGSDFAVPRPSGAPAYLLSLRPLSARRKTVASAGRAIAIMLLRDPQKTNRAAAQIFRDVLNLSDAEAALAQALQRGIPPNEYARKQALSANTVYTHLKRIKDKSGCHRMSALIRRLNDLQMLPLVEQADGLNPRRSDE